MLSWDEDGTVEESLNFMLNLMDLFDDVISFLSENKSSWEIVDGYITFDNDDLAEQYDNLLYRLYEEDTYTEEVPLENNGTGLIRL